MTCECQAYPTLKLPRGRGRGQGYLRPHVMIIPGMLLVCVGRGFSSLINHVWPEVGHLVVECSWVYEQAGLAHSVCFRLVKFVLFSI